MADVSVDVAEVSAATVEFSPHQSRNTKKPSY